MLIKTRLILNDVTWTLFSCVSVTARFIKENIQERSTSHYGCDAEFCFNAASQSIDGHFRSVCLQLL